MLTAAQRTQNQVRLLRALTPKTKKKRAPMPLKRPPLNTERDYTAALKALTMHAMAPAITALLGKLPALIDAAKQAKRLDEAMRHDGGEVKAIVDAAYRDITARLEVRDIAQLAHRYALQVSAHSKKELGRQLDAVFGVPLSIPDTGTPRTIDTFIDTNVTFALDNVERMVGKIEKTIALTLASSRLDAKVTPRSGEGGGARAGAAARPTSIIRSLPAPDIRTARAQSIGALQNVRLIVNRPADFDAQGLAAAIQRNVALGGSTAELAEEIEDEFNFTADHAAFIARDQVGTLNGQLNAQRSQSLGITRFIWRTAGDELVRDEHEELDGEVFDYDDPPDEGLPGEPINCRCTDEPVVEDLLEEEVEE